MTDENHLLLFYELSCTATSNKYFYTISINIVHCVRHMNNSCLLYIMIKQTKKVWSYDSPIGIDLDTKLHSTSGSKTRRYVGRDDIVWAAGKFSYLLYSGASMSEAVTAAVAAVAGLWRWSLTLQLSSVETTAE